MINVTHSLSIVCQILSTELLKRYSASMEDGSSLPAPQNYVQGLHPARIQLGNPGKSVQTGSSMSIHINVTFNGS